MHQCLVLFVRILCLGVVQPTTAPEAPVEALGDTSVVVPLPPGWVPSKLETGEDPWHLRITHEKNHADARFYAESRIDLADDIDAEQYLASRTDTQVSFLSNVELGEIELLQVAGRNAARREARGEWSGGKYVLLITVIETPNHFVLSTAMTRPSRYPLLREELRRIGETPREEAP
jgi:hypothetical protein